MPSLSLLIVLKHKTFLEDGAIDDYAKDGGPEVVWHLCSFYQDPLRS